MTTIPHDDCICNVQCPDEPQCACMWIYDEERCECLCGPDIKVDRRVPPDAYVDLGVKDLELAALGRFLARLSTADVLVPALLGDDKVSLRLKRVQLKDAIKQAGLVLG